jgi:hypothetical protein
MTLINRETFVPHFTDADGSRNGTVEVTIGRVTKRVSACLVPKYNWLFAYDVVGRYQQGGKVWPASIHQNGEGKENVTFGRDDRSPKFRKENNIYFA